MSEESSSVIPVHVGIILDGNRRWAKAQGLPTREGHRKGYETLKTVGMAGLERGIKYISAYVFSTENWNRAKEEVDYLMKLLLWMAKNEVDELHRANIRVRFVGSRERLSPKIIKAMDAAEAKTKNNTRGTLALCLNYGGHQEIADAVKKIIKSGIEPDNVTPETIADNLYAPDIPPVDFMVRTSGEQRISGFMLYRLDYAELYFIKKHWPEVTEGDLDEALAEYARRKRRFGK